MAADNIQNNPWFQLALVVVLSVAIIYGGYKLWPDLLTMQATIASLKDNITKLQKEVDEGRKLEERLPELRREIKQKELELENLKKIIPSDREAQDLIRKLERMAAETNLTIRSWNSQPTAAKEFYYEWPIALTVSASYHNLGKFFSKISNYARIINVQSVRVNAYRSNPPNPNYTIDASFTAVTYVYKDK